MRDVQLDVLLEVPYAEADRLGPAEFTTAVIEALREKADEVCDSIRGQLYTDREPEIITKRGEHKTAGGDWILVASRWWASVPENWSP